MTTTFVPKPQLPPPVGNVGILGWLRNNLFSSVTNGLLTLGALYLLVIFIPPIVDWTLVSADWVGKSQDDCTSGGACWVFIATRFDQFIYGVYPISERWRIDIMFALLVILLTPQFFPSFTRKALFGVLLLIPFPVIAGVLMLGGVFGLEAVPTHNWGGLALTLVLAFIGIAAALPFGVLLALGRRSEMPVIRSACVVFIEVWRGVPLISVLFMASVMLPLFLPEGVDFNKLLRALIGIVMFQSAYMAEVIRGGLQAIPKGQTEAAQALGLNFWKTMGLIILPQALKLVIPGIVNTFIALFKDTTLVLIISLLDILAMVQSAINDPAWSDVSTEGYLFAAFAFWIFCYGMSKYSQDLERRLHTGHKPR